MEDAEDVNKIGMLNSNYSWVENIINRYNFIMCLLCDHTTARDHWEMSEMKGANFGPCGKNSGKVGR